jgi:probable F420-dependent oxidoreductase
MKFTVDYPIVTAGHHPDVASGPGVTRIAQAAEECGYDALSFSEHPAPSYKWMNAGGHQCFDLTSALSFCAAVTSRIRLMTYLLVVPYHNPFVTAKALSTVDRLSGGRLTVVAGTGYLRSEFLALKVDMEQRNELFDESLEVIRGVWREVPFSFQGKHFTARGVASLPGPLQPGGPPILIGGNSTQARQRAARNQGWSPIMVSAEVTKTSRTPGISSVAELAAQIKQVRDAAAAFDGDAPPLTIQVHTPQTSFMQQPGSAEEHRDHLGQLAEAGVDAFVLRPPGTSVEGTVAALQEYAQTFISRLRSSPSPERERASYAVRHRSGGSVRRVEDQPPGRLRQLRPLPAAGRADRRRLLLLGYQRQRARHPVRLRLHPVGVRAQGPALPCLDDRVPAGPGPGALRSRHGRLVPPALRPLREPGAVPPGGDLRPGRGPAVLDWSDGAPGDVLDRVRP